MYSARAALALGRQDLGSLVDRTLKFCRRDTAEFKWKSWQRDDGRKVSLGRLPALVLPLSGLVTESLTITLPGFL